MYLLEVWTGNSLRSEYLHTCITRAKFPTKIFFVFFRRMVCLDSYTVIFYKEKMLFVIEVVVLSVIIIIIIIQHLYSAIVSYAGCRGACGAS